MSPLDPQRARDRFHAGDLAGAIADAQTLARDADAPDFARALAAVAAGEWAAGLLLEREDRQEDAAAEYRASEATHVWHFVTHLWARERLRDGLR